MANKLFSFFKQGSNTYEVKDAQARADITQLNNDLTVQDISYSSSIIVHKIDKLVVIYCFGGTHKDGDKILPSNSPYKPANNIVVGGFYAGDVARCGIRTDGTLIFTHENGSPITSTQTCFFSLAYTI